MERLMGSGREESRQPTFDLTSHRPIRSDSPPAPPTVFPPILPLRGLFLRDGGNVFFFSPLSGAAAAAAAAAGSSSRLLMEGVNLHLIHPRVQAKQP